MKEIREERNRLCKQSKLLREKAFDAKSFDVSMKIRENQNQVYNKWKFYDNMIKTMEQI